MSKAETTEQAGPDLEDRVAVDQIDRRATAAGTAFDSYVDSLLTKHGRAEDERGTSGFQCCVVPLPDSDLDLWASRTGDHSSLVFLAALRVEVDGEFVPVKERVIFSHSPSGLNIETTAFMEQERTRGVTLEQYTSGGLFPAIATNGAGKVEAFERLVEQPPV